MKRNLILLVLFTSLVCNVSADESQNAKSEMNAAQRKITQLTTQKKSVSGKIEKWNTDLQDAKSKVESLKDKQKSPSFKTASKKVEDLETKIKDAEMDIQQIDKSIDSLSNIISTKQQIIIASDEQKAKTKEEKLAAKEAKMAAKEAKAKERMSEELSIARAQYADEMYNEEKNSCETKSSTNATESNTISNDSKNKTSGDNVEGWFWIIIFSVVILIGIRRRYHCPKCGKWFTMDFEGAARTRAESGEMVYRKRYCCSNCGHRKTIFSPIPKKN